MCGLIILLVPALLDELPQTLLAELVLAGGQFEWFLDVFAAEGAGTKGNIVEVLDNALDCSN